MKNLLRFVQIFCLGVLSYSAFAQYPNHFTYDDENGLPSNEVYSIIQDHRGFIWIGCDAGLYKFDGIRYTAYKSPKQKSQSVTGLTLSPSGKIYCYNFRSQVMCVNHDSLQVLDHNLSDVVNLAVDNNEQLFVSHYKGIAKFNPESATWSDFWDFDMGENPNKFITKFAKSKQQNRLFFLRIDALGSIEKDEIQSYSLGDFQFDSPGNFVSEFHHGAFYIFGYESNVIFKWQDGRMSMLSQGNLVEAIQNRKITSVHSMPDGNLWISTYNGIIQYNDQTDQATLFYPEQSFSDCLIDREGNYWFSTLQSGILRVPNLHFQVWNKEHEALQNDKLTKIATDGKHVFFSNVSGSIGRLNTENYELKSFQTGLNADVQSFDFNHFENALIFNINNRLFHLKEDEIDMISPKIFAIKSFYKNARFNLIASSHGLYFNDSMVDPSWSREIKTNERSKVAFIAGNAGLLKINLSQNSPKNSHRFFEGQQVQSIDFDSTNSIIYALRFDGKIFRINHSDQIEEIGAIDQNIQGRKIRHFEGKVYIASNQGLLILNLENNRWQTINYFNGLTSENVQDLTFVGQNLYLATGKGLEKIPLEFLSAKTASAIVYLKNEADFQKPLNLKEGQSIALLPEASAFSSNGQFEYAYRILPADSAWIKLPATIEIIELQNLPTGDFTIELKVIDYLGNDSENTIAIHGKISPRFWKTIWFFALLLTGISLLIAFISMKIISNIRNREREKSALVKSQLTALKAQMNPHFMYNTLNSIQALILKNAIKDSNLYLSKFSQLMRKVLEVSELEEISLQEEIDILNLYLTLEKLRFGEEFTFNISCENDLKESNVSLPPLLLQPFAENAIKHGLLHKKGLKTLGISFEKEGKTLVCTIADNGIGRKHSEQIKTRQGSVHKSFSTTATQKRLELLNGNSHQNIKLEIIDLYELEVSKGTRVVLKIEDLN